MGISDDLEVTRQMLNFIRNKYNRPVENAHKKDRDKARVQYKSLCKRKCKLYDEGQTIVMSKEKYTDPKLYWKKLRGRKPRERELVSPNRFREHFMSLSTANTLQLETNRLSDYNVYVPLLDDEISLQEVERSIKHLKHGKSAGADNILSKFISYGRDEFKHILVNLYNKLYDAGHYPTQWTTGVIVPIYKKGARSNPANYRRITLTSIMSKLFTYILNERPLTWSELCCIYTES